MSYSHEWFLSLLAIIAILITPGPTNTLLAASGLNRGVRSSLALIPVELCGYGVSIATWGYLLISLSANFPLLPHVIKFLCALFIIWLAFKMWRTTLAIGEVKSSPVGKRALFMATLLNPKGLLFASAVFPSSTFVDLPSFTGQFLVFSLLLIPIACGWIAFGALLGSGRVPWLRPDYLQRGAALVLAVFALSIGMSALS